ncbi:MAG: hypothetical protein ABSH52_08810 [Terriglobia bacterium]|jgi:hypothetical protein
MRVGKLLAGMVPLVICLLPGPGGETDLVHQASCAFSRITDVQTDLRSMQFSSKFAF